MNFDRLLRVPNAIYKPNIKLRIISRFTTVWVQCGRQLLIKIELHGRTRRRTIIANDTQCTTITVPYLHTLPTTVTGTPQTWTHTNYIRIIRTIHIPSFLVLARSVLNLSVSVSCTRLLPLIAAEYHTQRQHRRKVYNHINNIRHKKPHKATQRPLHEHSFY